MPKYRESEMFDSIFFHTTDGIVLFDLQGTVLDVNPAFERMTGWNQGELMGRSYPPMFVEQDTVRKGFHDVVAGVIPYFRYQGKERRKDGSPFPVMATFSPIKYAGVPIVSVFWIIQDRTELLDAQEIIMQSEKLSQVGQLAAGMAHEIRNPLTSLKGFLKLLDRDLTYSHKYIEIMERELGRIETITNELLITSKPSRSKFEMSNVHELVGDVIALVEVQARLCDVQITTSLEAKTPMVLGDQNQLKQVFLNVMQNAIESMSNGGRLHVQAIQRNHKIHVVVTDEGCGISEEDLKRVGSPFFTTKGNGTGLGIMVSGQIIQSHHGDMEIISQVGHGTTVTVTLPLAVELHEA